MQLNCFNVNNTFNALRDNHFFKCLIFNICLPISNALGYEGTLGISKSKLSRIIKYIYWYHDKTYDSLKSHTVEVAVKSLFEAEILD
jgi:hypothetical protein